MKEYNILAYRGDIPKTIHALEANNIDAVYCETREDALAWVKRTLPMNCSVAVGGSLTLKDIGVRDYIWHGPFVYSNRYVETERFQIDPEMTAEEVRQTYLDAFTADYYLMSSNAITEQGDIVNVDGYGNRVAALSFGPRHVIIIIGRNKIVKDLPSAFERLQNIPTQTEFGEVMHVKAPCVSIGKCIDCKHKDRRCGIYSILRYQKNSQTQGKRRIVVLIVNEDLGC